MPTLSWLTREKDVKSADAVAYRLLEPERPGRPDGASSQSRRDGGQWCCRLCPPARAKQGTLPPPQAEPATDRANVRHTSLRTGSSRWCRLGSYSRPWPGHDRNAPPRSPRPTLFLGWRFRPWEPPRAAPQETGGDLRRNPHFHPPFPALPVGFPKSQDSKSAELGNFHFPISVDRRAQRHLLIE